MASRYVYDRKTLRYRDKRNGRFISKETVANFIDIELDRGFTQLDRALEQVIDGGLGLDEFQVLMFTQIRNLHIQMYAIGAGGRNAIDQRGWGAVGVLIREQYRYARGFLEEINQGNLSERQIRARLGMYANAVWTAFHRGLEESATQAGFTEEKRVRRAGDSCKDCIEYEAMGWQPLGTLPLPGKASICLSNCRCTKIYR